MSEQDKKKAVTNEDKKKVEGEEEMTEDELETVAGGVLIALNQGTVTQKDIAAQKGFEYGGLSANTPKIDASFKFIK